MWPAKNHVRSAKNHVRSALLHKVVLLWAIQQYILMADWRGGMDTIKKNKATLSCSLQYWRMLLNLSTDTVPLNKLLASYLSNENFVIGNTYLLVGHIHSPCKLINCVQYIRQIWGLEHVKCRLKRQYSEYTTRFLEIFSN